MRTQSLSTDHTPPISFPAMPEGQAPFRRPALQTDDTLRNAETKGTSKPSSPPSIVSHPKLTPVKHVRFSEVDMIHEIDGIHSSGNSILASFTQSLSDGSKRLRAISVENVEKLKTAAQAAQHSSFWSVLQRVAECILAAISAVFGASLIVTGGGSFLGGVLIASSIIHIANFAMRETGSWDFVAKKLASKSEDQKKISTYLPLATSVISAVLSLGGTAATALWTTLTMTQKAMTIAQVSMAMCDGAATVGRGISEAKALWIQGDLTEIEARNFLEKITFEDNAQNMQSIQKIINHAQESAEEVIALASQAYQNVRIQS